MKYFEESEFDCKCGCGFNNLDEDFAFKLDRARELAGIPFVVTSGCRCEKHNQAVGGKEDSSHLHGCAVDISSFGSVKRFKILLGLILAGFERIGIGREFIHVDSDETKSLSVIWLY